MSNKKRSVYEQRGVSATKADIHKAIRNIGKGLFPTAFCKILPDILGGSPLHCNVMHADTTGTKASLGYLAWLKTKNLDFIKGLAVDALVMNVDDIGCIGAYDNILVNQTLGRNARLIPGDVVEALITSANDFCEMLGKQNIGITCAFAGGETASVGDVVRTLDVGSSAVVRMRRKDVIDAGNISSGNVLVGISSTGRAEWENEVNSGMGSNGLTNSRHDTLKPMYRKYTETYAPQTRKELIYRGKYSLSSKLPGDPGFTIAKALLSPTRTYLPLIKLVLESVRRKYISGIIHCSGGGQTKIAHFGKGLRYMKVNPFVIPPLFQMLQEVCGLSWKEMYQVYNMGWRMEFVVKDRAVAETIIAIAQSCGIDAQIVGHVATLVDGSAPNQVFIDSEHGQLNYP
jgi:phosphoribosylformylglycinamidine cyclo-ligase